MSNRWLKALGCCQVIIALAWCVSAQAASKADRTELETMVKKYWAAEVQREYGALFDLLVPVQTSPEPRAEFVKIRTEKGPIDIVRAEVKDIDVDAELGLGWTLVSYDWVVSNFPGYPPRPAERWQQWRYTDRWYPMGSNEAADWPSLPTKLRPAAEEAQLKKRVAQAWQAKIDRDWKAIYGFMSPAFRAAVPLDAFMSGKAKYLYVTADVEWVEVTDADARARVSFSYKENEPAMSKMKPIDNKIIEPWVKAEGNWYIDAIVPDVAPAKAEASAPAKAEASAPAAKPTLSNATKP